MTWMIIMIWNLPRQVARPSAAAAATADDVSIPELKMSTNLKMHFKEL